MMLSWDQTWGGVGVKMEGCSVLNESILPKVGVEGKRAKNIVFILRFENQFVRVGEFGWSFDFNASVRSWTRIRRIKEQFANNFASFTPPHNDYV